MAQIIVHTSLSTFAALSAGCSQAGEIQVRPTEAEIQTLSSEQRDELVDHASTDGRIAYPRTCLSVTLPGWAGVLAGIDAAIQRAAEKRAEREAHIERERASYRRIIAGQPAEPGDWDSPPNYSKDDPEAGALWTQVQARRDAERTSSVLAADAALGDDPVAHVTDDHTPDAATFAVLNAARVWEVGRYALRPEPPRAMAVQAECERRKADAATARELALEPFRAALREYVIATVPNYARAALEGHDVTEQASTALLSEIESQLSEIGTLVEHHQRGLPEERDCPAQRAYDVLDRVRALTLVPDVFGEASSRIVRVDVSSGSTAYRTAVEFTWTWPDGDTNRWYVLADAAGLPAENEDETES